MSPLTQDQQYHLAPKAEGAIQVDNVMMCLGAAEATLRDTEREVRNVLMDAHLYCGLTVTDLAQITGWSRRSIRRKLQQWMPDDRY